MERTILTALQRWAKDPQKKPLLMYGARQVGKTWLLQELGRTAFDNTVYINLDGDELMCSQFDGDYDVVRIVRALRALTRQPIEPGRTLLILDEIQECPAALTSLKYFREKMPELAVAAAGSLLGLAEHHGTGFQSAMSRLSLCTP